MWPAASRPDGDESPYQYCAGNPVAAVDPSGLYMVQGTGAGGGDNKKPTTMRHLQMVADLDDLRNAAPNENPLSARRWKASPLKDPAADALDSLAFGLSFWKEPKQRLKYAAYGMSGGLVYDPWGDWTEARAASEALLFLVPLPIGKAKAGWRAASFAAREGDDVSRVVFRAGEAAMRHVSGRGAEAGIARHQYATRFVERYRSMVQDVGLEPKYYKRGGDGSLSIFDVYHTDSGRIFDWKFGNAARMSTAQRAKYEQHGSVTVFKYPHE